MQKGLKTRGECIDWKYNLKEILALYYLQKKKAEEMDIAKAIADRVDKLKGNGNEIVLS